MPTPIPLRLLRRPVLLGACLLAAVAGLHAQQPSVPSSRVFVEGEELVYNVRYSFFDLGQVRIKVLGARRTGESLSYQTKALIDSYKGVPFVDLHATYESLIDSTVFSRVFVGKSKEGDAWRFGKYTFEYDKQRALIEIGKDDSLVAKRETLSVAMPYQDGLSLFFYARDRLFCGKKIDVPTVVNEQKTRTVIDFKGDRSSVEIDAVKYPVAVVHFEGEADFVGIYGLTGGFEGWFSDDEARVPILAKMKVFIGSVTIELMSWKRPGWSPPRGED